MNCLGWFSLGESLNSKWFGRIQWDWLMVSLLKRSMVRIKCHDQGRDPMARKEDGMVLDLDGWDTMRIS